VIRLLTEIRNAWSEMLSGRSTSQVDQHADLQLQAA
jgi:hypothetical protein